MEDRPLDRRNCRGVHLAGRLEPNDQRVISNDGAWGISQATWLAQFRRSHIRLDARCFQRGDRLSTMRPASASALFGRWLSLGPCDIALVRRLSLVGGP